LGIRAQQKKKITSSTLASAWQTLKSSGNMILRRDSNHPSLPFPFHNGGGFSEAPTGHREIFSWGFLPPRLVQTITGAQRWRVYHLLEAAHKLDGADHQDSAVGREVVLEAGDEMFRVDGNVDKDVEDRDGARVDWDEATTV
jgi:hypothetical protein